jgi:hypothetical protein
LLFLLDFPCWHGLCNRFWQELNNDSKNAADSYVGKQKMTHEINLARTISTALTAILLATTASADTDKTTTVAVTAPAVISSPEVSRDLAEKATTAATEKAIAAVLAETKLDLDIRLIGPTSVKVAGDR